MVRTITDFAVTGSVGRRPLVQQRVAYTEATGGGAYCRWIMHPFDYKVISSTIIRYPSGVRTEFGVSASGGGPTDRVKGGSDRIRRAGTVITDLWLGDGTHVVFDSSGRATTVYDRHGLATTLTYGSYGLIQATDASGRFISYSYYAVPGTSSYQVRQATSSDGQWARYDWIYQNSRYVVAAVTYSDGTSGSYSYTNKRVPDVFRDTRAQARMQEVRFTFGGALINSVPTFPGIHNTLGSLALLTETHPGTGALVSARDGSVPYENSLHDYTEPYEAGGWYTGKRFEFRKQFLDQIVDLIDGSAATFTYDAYSEFLVSTTDPRGNTTTFAREPAIGRVQRMDLPDGSYVAQTFTDPYHPYFIATSRDERGNVTTYTRASNGVLTRVDYPDGSYETWADFTQFNQPREHRQRNGAVERFTYDGMGRLLRRYEPSYGASVDYTEYTYYPDGHAWEDRVWKERDPRGKFTTYEYDYGFVAQGSSLVQGTTACAGRGLVTKTTFADGTYTSAAYDKFGNPVWQENELRQRTTTVYDDYQRPATVTDPLGRTTTYDYSIGGYNYGHTENKPSFITHPSQRKEAFTFDGQWRTLTHTVGYGTAEAATTTNDYDLAGNLESVTDPDGRVTTFAYDNRNRRTHQYAPFGRTTQWQYDAVGNVTRVTNPDGTFTRKEYDAMSRVIHAYDERDQHTGTTYHASGQVHVITDPRGSPYTHAYDAADRMSSRAYPDGTAESWGYDAAGNKTSETTRTGQVLRLYYDDRGREYWREWDNSAAPFVGTQYDAASRVTNKYNWHGWLTYGFDAAGQVTSETQKIYGPTSTEDGQTQYFYFGYDGDGNRTWLSSPSLYQGYTYNARQQMSAVQFGGGWDWATYTYTAAGLRSGRGHANGANAYGYDAAGRLESLRSYRTADDGQILLQRFGYDLRDRRTWQMRDDAFGDVWEYFPDSQLKKQRTHVWRPDQNVNGAAAFTDTFDYDPAGNRTSWDENGAVTTYTADSCNRYTSITGLAIQHDGRGNVTQLGGWTFGQDPENRMVRATGPGHDYRFHYDAMGRLSKIVDWAVASGAYEYRFYDGSQPLVRTRGDGSWIDHLVWGASPDELVSRYVPDQHPSDWWSRWQFFNQDPLNSVVAVTDHTGAVLERYKYDAFGEAAIYDASWNPRSTSAIGNRWLFTGQEFWPEIGIHNYKARWYCNRIGRFLQNDPIRFDAGDLNLYRYVSNKPNCSTDPSGLAETVEVVKVNTSSVRIVTNRAEVGSLSIPHGPSNAGITTSKIIVRFNSSDGVDVTIRINEEHLSPAGVSAHAGELWPGVDPATVNAGAVSATANKHETEHVADLTAGAKGDVVNALAAADSASGGKPGDIDNLGKTAAAVTSAFGAVEQASKQRDIVQHRIAPDGSEAAIGP